MMRRHQQAPTEPPADSPRRCEACRRDEVPLDREHVDGAGIVWLCRNVADCIRNQPEVTL